MERMINDRLVWFLESHNLLADIQCGFRSQKSTLDHLVLNPLFVMLLLIKNMLYQSFSIWKRHMIQLGGMEF
jgi:hypothetical protein